MGTTLVIYGVDLGTTYCAVSRLDPSRGPEPIPVQFDEGGAFPSLVLLAPGGRSARAVVGAKARSEYARLVGRRADPPPGVHLIRGAKDHIGRKPEGGGGPPWVVGDQEFTATDVSALILRALRKRVEQQNLPSMQRVVVTHPQKFRNLQRLATQQAVQLAGLSLVGMLTEPDAAAWAYESVRPSAELQKTVVFDFGGGTLDVVLMEASRDVAGRLQTRVVASEGDSCGGLEIDRRIVGALLARYSASTGDEVDDDGLRAQARDEVVAQAEHLKRALNTPDAARDPDWREHVKRVELPVVPGLPKTVVEVTLGELSDWIRPVLDRAVETLDRALSKGGWRDVDVYVVRMTGQSSLLVAMQRRLIERFGKGRVALEPHPHSPLHPSTIVSAGAALAGEAMLGAEGRVQLIRGAIPETISFTSRLSPADDAVEVFEGIPAGTPTPARFRKVFGLDLEGRALPDGGRTLPIEVFEGASRTPIGTYLLTFQRPLRHDDDVEIELAFGSNGRFAMRVNYDGEMREARLTEAECILDDREVEERRRLLDTIELEV